MREKSSNFLLRQLLKNKIAKILSKIEIKEEAIFNIDFIREYDPVKKRWLVHWENFPDTADPWEPYKNLCDNEIFVRFEKNRKFLLGKKTRRRKKAALSI